MKYIITMLMLGCSMLLMAQGEIKGKVVDAESGLEATGAIITIKGTTKGAAADFMGEYSITNVAAGTYTIECRLVSYQPVQIDGVVVTDGKATVVDIKLQTQSVEGQTIEIIEFKKTNSEVATLIELRDAKSVGNGVSQAQIAKSPDRNASEVARRIPGVTIVDNRFVMVRGLSERYNSVMLNGILVPSMESDVKSFSFDVIPSVAIDRFLIFKSPSPDLPAEFAGGSINVYTRSFPDAESTLDVNLTAGFRGGTTFLPFRTNTNSKSEWLGFDGGDRALPDNFPTNVRNVTDANELQTLGRSLSNSWDYEENNASIDPRISVVLGKKIKREKVLIGNFTAINYSNANTTVKSNRLDYNVYDEINQASDTVFNYQDTIFQKNINLSVLHNWAFKWDKSSIEFKGFLNQNGMQSNTFRTGVAIEEGNYREEYSFRYTERRIMALQAMGKHEAFGSKGELTWALGYGSTRRQDPDWKRIRYTSPLDNSDPYFHAYIPFSAQPFFLGRLYLNLVEDVRTYSVNYEHKLKEMYVEKEQKKYMTIKVGTYIEDKDRHFSGRNIGYAPSSIFQFDYSLDTLGLADILAPENINTTTGLKLDEDTRGADSYHASNNLFATYAMLYVPMKKWGISGGVRLEQNRQALSSADLTGQPVEVEKDSLVVLPSINIGYKYSEKTLFRLAYGRTVNRPEFRELAPFSFYDFENNFIITGNPSLDFAVIDNYDARWEYYPTPGQIVSAGLFYKRFQNPIEQYFVPGVGSGGTRSFAPGNALSATSYGVEVDLRKSMREMTKSNFINSFTIVANASYIISDITLSPEDLETGLNSNRPMVGQSPYIINAGLYYDNDSLGIQVTAMYNIIGPRVVIVGIPDVPEVYEMPRNLIDLSVTKSFKSGFAVRFAIQDLLNQNVVLIQDANEDGVLDRNNDQQLQVLNRGTYYTFSLLYKFRSDNMKR